MSLAGDLLRRAMAVRAQHGNVDPDGQIVDAAREGRLRSAIGDFLAVDVDREEQLELTVVLLGGGRA